MSDQMVTLNIDDLKAMFKEAVSEALDIPLAESPESAEQRKLQEEQAKIAAEDMRRAREKEIEAHNAAIQARLDWENLPDEEKRRQEDEAAKKNAAYALISLKLDPNVDPSRLFDAAVLAEPAVVAEILEKMDDVHDDLKQEMITHATNPVEPTPQEVVGKWLESMTGGRVNLELLKAALK